MPIDIATVAEEQAASVLGIREGHFVDLKAIDVAPARLTEVVSAFANSDGGELYIGIDEDKVLGKRSWRGFKNQEAANGHLQIFEKLFPLGQDFAYGFLECAGKPGLVLHVQIRKTKDIKRSSSDMPYIRRGAQKLPVDTPEKLRLLEYCKGITSFETSSVACGVRDITHSLQITEFMLKIVPSSDPEPWLSKQQLIVGDKPTVAGVLLFADEPQALLPKRCGVKLYRYKSDEAEGSRECLAGQPTTIEGSLYVQIQTAVNETIKAVESIKVLGDEGLEHIKYPSEALHEIITNALLHRDYSIADDVHIRIFDDRIEVESPGRLPAHVTVKNILNERFARNGNVVRLINKFPDPPNKDIGEGLNTAFDAMRQLKLKPPEITERENSVLVFIRHQPLATPEEMVMDYLGDNSEINNSKGREICHIGSENVMKRVFERMIKSKMIERVPGRNARASAYRIKTPDRQETLPGTK